MAPGVSGQNRALKSALPDGSYAKAAKSLQTSGLSVSERIDVAEALLHEASRLTPRPEPLVRQHTVFALCSSRSEFAEYRTRYWKLLCVLHERDPEPLPETIAVAATSSFQNEESSSAELSACIDALHALFARSSLRPKMEILAALFSAACECRLDGRYMTTDIEGLDQRLERLLVAILIQYDDVQRRNQIAKRTFGNAVKFLIYPVLRCDGVVRKAGEIVLRHGLFPNVEDILNTGTYYEGLYDLLRKGNTSPFPQVLPKLVEFLLRSCKKMARDQPSKALQFPRAGEKRGIDVVNEHAKDVAGSAGVNGSLPREVAIPVRFLKDMCKALVTNIGQMDSEHAHITLAALTCLLTTATDLHAYRPSYESGVARAFKKVKTTNKDGKIVGKVSPREETIGTMMSKLLSFVTKQLHAWSIDTRSSRGEDTPFTQVAILAQCGTAIIRMSVESVRNDLPDLLNAVLKCASKVKKANGSCNVLAFLLREMFRVYSATRNIPKLFKLLASSLNEESVLDNLHLLLTESTLQEAIVESIWALPRGHAEDCVIAVTEPGCVRPKSAASVCFLLSLIVESVDLSTLTTILPVLGKGLGTALGSASTICVHLICGLAFVHASVAWTLAKNALGESSTLYSTFASSSTLQKLLAEVEKAKPKIVQGDHAQQLGFQVCELRLLAALTHVTVIDCSGEHGSDSSAKAMGRALSKFAGLPSRAILMGNTSQSVKPTSFGEQWRALLVGHDENWAHPILKIAGSLGPLLDFLVWKNGHVENAEAAKGIKRILSIAMTTVSDKSAFLDGFLESKVTRFFVSECAISVLRSKSDDAAKLSVLELLPMLTARCSSPEELILAAEKIACDSSNAQTLRVPAERCANFQRTQINQSSKCKRRTNALALRRIRCDLDCNLVNDPDGILKHSLAHSETILDATQKVAIGEKVVENLEMSTHAAVHALLDTLENCDDICKVLGESRTRFSRLVVCLCYWVWNGKTANLGAYLQLISVLSRDEGNYAIERVADLVVKKIEQVMQDAREDVKVVNIPWLQRLMSLSTALVHGMCGGDSYFNWNSPSGGILRSVERSTRGATPISGRTQLVTKLGLISVQSIATVLWQTRHANFSFKQERGDGYSVQTSMFIDEHSRIARTGQLLAVAEWAVASISMEGGRTTSVHECELVQIALIELLGIASDSPQSKRMSAIQTGIVRAACMQGRRTGQGLACLRCVRAALRSAHLDAACARVISRHFEKVSGAFAVSAIADTASALTRVHDPAVREALEHGAAALLKDMSAGGRSEALMALSDAARDVLRALMETYRQDFQYNRN